MLTQEQDVELQLLREALHRKEKEVDDMRAQLAFANSRMHHLEVIFFLLKKKGLSLKEVDDMR
jgi:hypothetical protein